MSHANERLFDHELARKVKLSKSRDERDKRMSLKDAVFEYVQDGYSIIETGFAYVRGLWPPSGR
ncbi:MAG: hypothetical protein SWK76_03605 [Actinomycetota bacterium]|nr:hypothetical protein [Actinomycetota bacterium]